MVTQQSYLVVGGCGFLGRYIVEHLLNRGEKNVTAFDIRKTFEDPRVKFVIGDISKLSDLTKAFEGVDTVIHTASPAAGHGVGMWDLFHKVNVVGTHNVIEACIQCKVKRLVYTSSATVVWYGQDIANGDETLPYAKTHLDPYNQTKEMAEREVLESNGKGGLLTVALRPAAMFGPRDAQALIGFHEVGKSGKSKWVQIGTGKNKFDWTYVENAAYAHVLAADKLTNGSPVAGQVYFITNDDPMPFWDFAKYVWRNTGAPTPKIAVPAIIMYWIAMILAFFVRLLSPIVHIQPTFTPLRVTAASATRYFNISRAKKELGYKPLVSMEEGLKRSVEWLKQLDQDKKKS